MAARIAFLPLVGARCYPVLDTSSRVWLPDPDRVAPLDRARRLLDPVTDARDDVRREHGTLPRPDQPIERPPLRWREIDGRIGWAACEGIHRGRIVGGPTDMPETPDDILRALADPERLAIAGALARRDASASELADATDIRVDRVRRHLNRLVSVGVVRLNDDRRSYRLDPETLRWAAEQVGPPRDAGIALGAANEDEEAVLRTFFRGGRLTEVPTKESKRRIVLERIAAEFEPGVRYDEKTVNVIVGAFHNDYAALRRYLVDEGFLSREAGEYWRSG